MKTEIQFYISIHENNLEVTCSLENEGKSENLNDYSWGSCLQNIVLFGLSFMAAHDFQLKNSIMKTQLRHIMNRIKQFEKLGHIELSKNVLGMFLTEFRTFIHLWFQFVETNGHSFFDDCYLIRSTIGLLVCFHLMYFHWSAKTLT
jgi:hypothetical protein